MSDEENVVTEEWVDSNVTGNDGTDDSVTDCCCDKRVTIDDGNWCVKMPRRELTVRESIAFLKVIDDICKDFLPHFGTNYDGFYDLRNSIFEYKKNALDILEENECIEFNGDVSYHGDKL